MQNDVIWRSDDARYSRRVAVLGHNPLGPTTVTKSQRCSPTRPGPTRPGPTRLGRAETWRQTKTRCVYESCGDHDQPL